MKEEFQQFLPLATAALHILLSLTGEPIHGYGIMLEVARQSGGTYKIGPGTLYDNLDRLLANGLVSEARGSNDDRRRYQLTTLGRQVLKADLERLRKLLEDAALRLKMPQARGSR